MIWALRNVTTLVSNLDTDEWSFSDFVSLSVSSEGYCTKQCVAGWVRPRQQQQRQEEEEEEAPSLFTDQPLTGH